MTELGSGTKIPSLWRMSALLDTCLEKVTEQVLPRLDEMGAGYRNLKAEVIPFALGQRETGWRKRRHDGPDGYQRRRADRSGKKEMLEISMKGRACRWKGVHERRMQGQGQVRQGRRQETRRSVQSGTVLQMWTFRAHSRKTHSVMERKKPEALWTVGIVEEVQARTS